MSGKFLARASALSLALILAACGGDDGSTPLAGAPGNDNVSDGGGTGTDTDSGNNGGDSETPTVASIAVLTSSPQIGTSGLNQAEISALVRDSGGVTLEGIDVRFSADNNGTLTVTQGTTNESGIATATVSSQTGRTNRTITVTAEAANISSSTNVAVTGTTLSISGPSAIPLNDTAQYTAALRDSDGGAIAGESISIESSVNNAVSPGSAITNSSGEVTFEYTAASSGTDTLTVRSFSGESSVSALQAVEISPDTFIFTAPTDGAEVQLAPATETLTIRWEQNGTPIADGTPIQFSTTRGTLVPASGLVNTTNGNASITISSDTAGPSLIEATPSNGGPTVKRSIEFVAATPAKIRLQADRTQLAPRESTTITATVQDSKDNLVKNAVVNFNLVDSTNGGLSETSATTNSQGQAKITYTAGGSSSNTDGVLITASTAGIDATENLTIGGQALRISIGTGNELFDVSPTTYQQPWTVIVTDSSGNAQANKTVQLSVTPTEYVKGIYDAPDTASGEPENQWQYEPATACVSEDVNQNGSLDAGEDANNNGTLEPDASASTPIEVLTNADGIADFNLTYLKSQCSWIGVELRAVTTVSGTESDTKQSFRLSCAAPDLFYAQQNPQAPAPGTSSPYGVSTNCADPN